MTAFIFAHKIKEGQMIKVVIFESEVGIGVSFW